MNIEEKEKLALTRDSSDRASAIRIKAARLYAGQSQEVLGKNGGISKAAVANIEKGRSFPSRALMTYLFREHRIDFNFLIFGVFSQLPLDVQDRLFPLLEDVHTEWDPEPNSDRSQAKQ